MSEEINQPKRTLKTAFNRKFGVSEVQDRERRGRRDDDARGGRKTFRDRGDSEQREERRSRGDRPFRDREGREGRGDRPFNRDRRPRRFDDRRGDRPFRGGKDAARGAAPVYRQRPEQKEAVFDENLDEQVLEARSAQVEAIEDPVSNPPWFKKLIALTTEKGREREGHFLGEGVHVVDELVSHHREIVIAVYVVEGFSDENLIEKINEAEVNLHVLTEEQMKRLSSTVTTQGIIAHCRCASNKPNYEQSRSVLTLVDAVQDPGNLGTLFRTSLGFGSNGMVLGRGTVNPFNPKVVRGSSGTFLRVPFEYDVDLVEHINFLRSKGYTIIASDLHARQSLGEIPARKLRKMAFLVGNEGAGTNQYLIELADETVKIPMSSELESLNVAVAHGILSYEAAKIQEELK